MHDIEKLDCFVLTHICYYNLRIFDRTADMVFTFVRLKDIKSYLKNEIIGYQLREELLQNQNQNHSNWSTSIKALSLLPQNQNLPEYLHHSAYRKRVIMQL